MPGTRRKRFARRLQVKFTALGETRTHSGYTTDIPATGMFIGTGTPFKPGTRARIEVTGDERSVCIEGVVVHAARVSPLLSRIRKTGMGVRFLGIPHGTVLVT